MDYERLKLEGFRPEPPRGGWIDAASIDRAVCDAATCQRCGWRGLRYEPYTRERAPRYRAFATCPNCGHVEEF